MDDVTGHGESLPAQITCSVKYSTPSKDHKTLVAESRS